ncbi:hypothetical protein WMY93_005903 [Mugilogobius chulae]|uniref:Calx-beta domain-containing protein n=1 Tax=Mugilogobius chulae TaxID=88201 RepID=A0AAW0PXP6_9GOBI
MEVRVVRTCGARGAVAVPYKTIEGTAKGGGEDFEDTHGVLEFDNNEIIKSFQINIIDDDQYEKNKNFFVEVGEPRLLEMSQRKGVAAPPTLTPLFCSMKQDSVRVTPPSERDWATKAVKRVRPFGVALVHSPASGFPGGREMSTSGWTLDSAFSVTLFTIFAFICIAVLIYRRRPSIGGELGGPRGPKS